jgi:Leucine-rich repeat (LRR) protein
VRLLSTWLGTHDLISLCATSKEIHASMRWVDLDLFHHHRGFTAEELMLNIIRPTGSYWRIIGIRMRPVSRTDPTVSARYVTPGTVRRLRLSQFMDLHRHVNPLALVTLVIHDPRAGMLVIASQQTRTLTKCLNLHRFAMQHPGFSDLTPLCGLTNLRELDLRNCTAITNLKQMRHLPLIERVCFSGCTAICNLDGLQYCTHMKVLVLRGCHSIVDVTALTQCRELRYVHVVLCTRLRSLSGLDDCTSLRKLEASCCRSLCSIDALTGCTALRHLDLRNTLVDTVSPISTLTRLCTLDLSQCHRLQAVDLAPLIPHVRLRTFSFSTPVGRLNYTSRRRERLLMTDVVQQLIGSSTFY